MRSAPVDGNDEAERLDEVRRDRVRERPAFPVVLRDRTVPSIRDVRGVMNGYA
jgi:hypothetical protein